MDEVFVSQAVANPTFVLDWMKGFKSDIGFWEPFVRNVSQSCNANTEVMGFENPNTEIDFLPRYRQSTYDRFFWKTDNKKQPLTHIAGAHSLGALLLLEHLIDDENAQVFSENYDGLFLANPFLGDPYHDMALCRAFSKTWPMRNWPVGSSLIEKWKIGTMEEGYEANPTHLQSTMLHREAGRLLDIIKQKGKISDALNNIPIAIIAGENDTACDNKKIDALGETLGIDVITYKDTAHNPLLCNEDALEHFKYWSLNVVEHNQKPKPPSHETADLDY